MMRERNYIDREAVFRARRQKGRQELAIRKRRKRRRRRMRLTLLALEFAAIFLLGYLIVSFLPAALSRAQSAQKINVVANAYESAEAGAAPMPVRETLRRAQPKKKTVVLDAGHGGKDAGCVRDDVYEKDLNLDIVFRARRMLLEEGYDAVLTRDDDSFVELYDRCAIANETKDAIFVSVHINAMEDDADTNGVECYCNENVNADSARLASLVYDNVAERTLSHARKFTSDSDLYVVNHARVPSCLIETGFLTSDAEFRKLTDGAYREKIARGVADGVIAYFTAENG